MCVLIHTAPKSRFLAIRSARPWSLVQTEDASPYCTPFAQASASSSAENCCTVITGPKISCCTISSSWRRSPTTCLLYTSDAADEEDSVDLGGRRIIKKK